MSEKMQIRLFKLTHSLMTRFLLICCVTILPISIFSGLALFRVGGTYRNLIIETLENNVSGYTERMDNYNDNLSEAFSSRVVSDYITELSFGNTSDSVLTAIRLKNKMCDLDYDGVCLSCCYVYDKDKDVIGFFQQTSSNQPESSTKQQIEDLVKEEQLNWFGERYISDGDRNFLLVGYSYNWFDFGYVLDLDAMAEDAYDQAGIQAGKVYFLDDENRILAEWPRENKISGDSFYEGNAAGGLKVHTESAVDSSQIRVVLDISASDVLKMFPLEVYLLFAFIIISILIMPLLYLMSKKMMLDPLYALADAMANVADGDLDYRVREKEYHSYQMNYITCAFNRMVDEIKHIRISGYEQEISRLRTEAINAHLQVNQHMLLNSLNMVYSLIMTRRYSEGAEFTQLLMKYFQYTMRKNSPLVTVHEEMVFISDYIRLQKIRFKDRFSASVAVEEDAKPYRIPQLLIQGFVENAIKYAILPDEITEILVSVRHEKSRLLISVCDTGAGIDEATLQKIREGEPVDNLTGRHVGFWNSRKRLDYYYGKEYEFHITSVLGEGTQIFLTLPDSPAEQETIVSQQRLDEMKNGELKDDTASDR